MRLTILTFAAVAVLAGGALLGATESRADPYRWCADYGGGDNGGGTNCGFVTLQQCMATVSGIGGFCRENPFYDGIPFDRAPAPKRKPKRR
jgi:hypothetical protein